MKIQASHKARVCVFAAGSFAAVMLAGVSAHAALSSSSRIGPTGVGPIVIGTTAAQAARTGTQFVSTEPASGTSCHYLRPASLSGLSFMVEDGTIRRAEVTTPLIATTDGFHVGDPAGKLKNYYGERAQVAPDKYDPQAQTVTVVPSGDAGAKYRMVFKVKGATVQAIYAGALPQVAYVEGCS